jgi:hypothetical protein
MGGDESFADDLNEVLVLVAEAQVLVEGYFCKDGTYVQPLIAPSLESTLYNPTTSLECVDQICTRKITVLRS